MNTQLLGLIPNQMKCTYFGLNKWLNKWLVGKIKVTKHFGDYKM